MKMMIRLHDVEYDMEYVINLYGINIYRGIEIEEGNIRLWITYGGKDELIIAVTEKEFEKFEKAISSTVGFY